ncbi:Cro/CI family transcriptional regulator [Rosenbergiella epipactidis]|uniref:Cro/CI family transcriptional regulator n=1 Tax=Rosenbergiella epipactidis TaxID=1544694 RepID=UPI001F4D9CC4|nr:Cro/CI family transcriptional regulator [Rosenbergiella epipactidis]
MIKNAVCEYFGSQHAIALALGLSDSAVSQWKEIIPEGAAFKIERITKGKLKYQENLYQKQVAA